MEGAKSLQGSVPSQRTFPYKISSHLVSVCLSGFQKSDFVRPQHMLSAYNHKFLPECDNVTFGSLLSQIRLPVCRLSSVTFVHPTLEVEAFGNISSPLVPQPSSDFLAKFYGDRPRGTPTSGALNATGVAK